MTPLLPMAPARLLLATTLLIATSRAALSGGGPSPPAPPPPPGQWSPEHNLTFCNGKQTKSSPPPSKIISLAQCKAMCVADPGCFFVNHAEVDPGQCQLLSTCTGTACEYRKDQPVWWSAYAYGRNGAPPYPGCVAPPPDPGPVPCPAYHGFKGKIDPAGPLQTPDGVWHMFSCCDWAHCTASDLIHWNCSHPQTGLSGTQHSSNLCPLYSYTSMRQGTLAPSL